MLLVVGSLLDGIGNAFYSASGEFGSAWYLGESFGAVDAVIAAVAVALVLWLRVLVDWPEDTPSGLARWVLSLALAVVALLVVASGINIAQAFLDHREFGDLGSGGEQLGAVVMALGAVVLAVAVGIAAIRGFSLLGRSQEPEPSRMPPGDVGDPLGEWRADPFGSHEYRYWDGARWTEHVSDRGLTGIDPPMQSAASVLPAPPRTATALAPPPPQSGPVVYVEPRNNGLAIASMVLGIVWVYWIGSILAVIFGHIALSQIEKSQGAQRGRGMAIAGLVLGYVGVGLLVLVIVVAAANFGKQLAGVPDDVGRRSPRRGRRQSYGRFPPPRRNHRPRPTVPRLSRDEDLTDRLYPAPTLD